MPLLFPILIVRWYYFIKKEIFMLKSLRDGAKSGFLKFILLGFMALAVGGLVLTDVGGFFRGGVSNNNVAEGKKGIEITAREFDRVVRRILSRQGMTPQEAYRLGLINQILNNEIQTRILTRSAYDLGLVVGDEAVTAQIAELAEPLAQDGTSKSEAVKQILRAQGVSEGEFISTIRQEMAVNLFRNALLSGAGNISEAQAKTLYQYQNENRQFEGFTLNNARMKGITAPTDVQLTRYYEGNKNQFLIPERRDITIATLKKEMIEDRVTITDEELKEVYDNEIDLYRKPEQRTLQQAILTTQGEADDVFSRVQKGTSLERAIKDVTGADNAYLGENDFAKDGLLEDIAAPVFEAEKGDVIGPIQTALGIHVLVLKDIIEPRTESFDTVKKAIRDNMLQERLLDDLVETANMLDDQLASGMPLEDTVQELGLTTEAIKAFNQAGMSTKNKDLFSAYQGDKAEILELAFDYNEGEATPVIELDDGRFIAIRIDAIQERSFEPFESVKKDLKKQWMDEQRSLMNRARAEDLFQQVQSGMSLKDAAKKAGVRVQKFNKLKRDGEPKAPLTFGVMREIFDAPQSTPLKLSVADGFVIGQVTDISLPTTDKAKDDIESLKNTSQESLPQEILTQYITKMSGAYKVKINDRLLGQMYGEVQ